MSEYYFTKDELYHHGIKGQKWGQRRFQNPDGSLTPAGREHYGYGEARSKMLAAKSKYKSAYKDYSKSFDRAINLGAYVRPLTKKGRSEQSRREDDMIKKAQLSEKARQEYKQAKKEYKQSDEYKARQAKLKKAAIIGAAAVGTALAAYGGYKLYKQGKLNDEIKRQIKDGESTVNRLYEQAKSSVGKDSAGIPLSSSVTYRNKEGGFTKATVDYHHGKDGKVEGYSFRNYERANLPGAVTYTKNRLGNYVEDGPRRTNTHKNDRMRRRTNKAIANQRKLESAIEKELSRRRNRK